MKTDKEKIIQLIKSPEQQNIELGLIIVESLGLLDEIYQEEYEELYEFLRQYDSIQATTCKKIAIISILGLKKLDLSYNKLSSLPESFGNLSNLRILYLNDNQLSSLPESFGNLSNLRIFGLHKNQLSSLPKSFGKLNNLTRFNLRYNQLSSLPESFGNLSNLTRLWLSHNFIHHANRAKYEAMLPQCEFYW